MAAAGAIGCIVPPRRFEPLGLRLMKADELPVQAWHAQVHERDFAASKMI